MFNDLHTIDWESLRVPDAPKWIRGLVSEDMVIRDESFDDLRDTYIYEHPELAQHVVRYMIRIISSNNKNADIPLLLEFLKSLRVNIIGFLDSDIAIAESQSIKSQIDNLLNELKKLSLSTDEEIRDSAISLIHDIEQD